MSLLFKIYLSLWLSACTGAVILCCFHRSQLELFRREYWDVLFEKWKVSTFLIAAIGMIIIAPYSGDPTWDYFDAGFMSVFTFFTAPWVVGVLYRFIRFKKDWKKVYIAICIWMFSASWSYDGYLILRDGGYPVTWLPNIFLSSILYLCGGLVWSLAWNNVRGVHFSFTESKWPISSATIKLSRVIWFALPFMLLVAILIGAFLF